MSICLVLLFAYLLGSVPAGYLAGRMAGVDIRKVGSGNIGATNVLRTLGKKYGYPVFLFDFFKGVAAVELAFWIASRGNSADARELWGILGGVASVVGHSYPIWLGFRGGKGVATSLGVLLALAPIAAIITVGVWLIVFFTTGYVSLASISAIIALPLAAWLVLCRRGTDERALLYFSIALAVLVIWRHRSNIARLWQGSETRFQRK